MDALTSNYDSAKSHEQQNGELSDVIRHMYANMEEPLVCVVTSIALHIICHPELVDSLWNQAKAKSAFDTWLKAAAKDLEEHPLLGHLFRNLNIGMHSFRKGSSSTLGSEESCPIFALYLRACWSLGKVIEAYIKANPSINVL